MESKCNSQIVLPIAVPINARLICSLDFQLPHLSSALQLYGVGIKAYYQFCPMADNNKGAYWLSKEETILNPYFGKAMHSCGEIKYVINE